MVDYNKTESRIKVGQISPKLIEMTQDVLFGDIWERVELSKRDRSLVTVAALVALGRENQLPVHLTRGLDNGLTREEIAEIITHLAFYSGWPTAMTAANIAYDLFATVDGAVSPVTEAVHPNRQAGQ